MKKLRHLGLFVVAFTLSCSSLQIDGAFPASQAGDQTAIMAASGPGCTSKPEVGFAFCRKAKGEILGIDSLHFFAPKTNCDRDSCVTVRVLDRTGVVADSIAFPKEGGEKVMPFADILKTDTFKPSQEGVYTVLIRMFFENNDGREQVIVQRGVFYLLVYETQEPVPPHRTYQPYHNARGAAVWAYQSSFDNLLMKWSTAGRAYVGNNP